MKKEQSLEPVAATRLKELAKTLKSKNRKFVSVAALVQKQGHEAYRLAVDCGSVLNEAKELLHRGDFTQWCEAYCRGISEKTRQNYMRVATAHLASLAESQTKTIKEAYIELGIVPTIVPKQDDVIDIEHEKVQTPAAIPLVTAPSQTATVAETAAVVAAPVEDKSDVIEGSIVRAIWPYVARALAQEAIEQAAAGESLPVGAASLDSLSDMLNSGNTGFVKGEVSSVGTVGPGRAAALPKETMLNGMHMTEVYGDEQFAHPLPPSKSPAMTPESVDAWLETDAGKDWWVKQYNFVADAETALRQKAPSPEQKRADKKAEREAADLANGRTVRIATGPPMTLALFQTAIDTLIALVPTDAQWADYCVIFDKASAALEKERKPKATASAYTA